MFVTKTEAKLTTETRAKLLSPRLQRQHAQEAANAGRSSQQRTTPTQLGDKVCKLLVNVANDPRGWVKVTPKLSKHNNAGVQLMYKQIIATATTRGATNASSAPQSPYDDSLSPSSSSSSSSSSASSSSSSSSSSSPSTSTTTVRSAFTCVRAEFVMPASAKELFFALCNLQQMHQWDATFYSGAVLRMIDDSTDLLHLIFLATPHKPRDFVVYCTRRRLRDGTFLIAMRSVDNEPKAGIGARDPRWVRAHAPVFGFVIRPKHDTVSAAADDDAAGCSIVFCALLDKEGEKLVADDLCGLEDHLVTKFAELKQLLCGRREMRNIMAATPRTADFLSTPSFS
jgi:hypothetical protein